MWWSKNFTLWAIFRVSQIGVVEYWSVGGLGKIKKMILKLRTFPILHYSITPILQDPQTYVITTSNTSMPVPYSASAT